MHVVQAREKRSRYSHRAHAYEKRAFGPGQTISSPQSGSNNDELPTSVDDKAVGAAAGSSARDDFWDEGGAGGEDATRPPRDVEEGAGGETTKCDD